MAETDGRASFKERIALTRMSLDYIEKRGRNTFYNYDYVTAGDVQGQCGKVLAEHGIIIRKQNQKVEFDTVKTASNKEEWRCQLTVEYGLADTRSDEVIWYQSFGEGRDTGDKAYNKALTSARKYFLIDALCLGIGDDPEASGDEERDGRLSLKPEGSRDSSDLPIGGIKCPECGSNMWNSKFKANSIYCGNKSCRYEMPKPAPQAASGDSTPAHITIEQAQEMAELFRTEQEITNSDDLYQRSMRKWQLADLAHTPAEEFEPRMAWLRQRIEADRAKYNGSATMREPGEE
jgi:hypothetical protein